jgi:hypothetical protein
MRRDLLAIAALTLAGTVRATADEGATSLAGNPRIARDGGPVPGWQLELQRIQSADKGTDVALQVTSPPPAPSPGCRLLQPGADATTSADCLRCHGASGRDNHPVDLDYEAARSGGSTGLRPLAEIVRRGLLVPEGRLRCVTCHDGASRWTHRLAMPPGARLAPAVDVHDPTTYEGGPFPSPPPAGTAVATKPLCTVCHTIGD